MRHAADSSICPECGATLETGYLSYCTGAVWHQKKPVGLARMFWSAFYNGKRVFGGIASMPYVSSVTASRCPDCSCVVIPGRRV